MPYPYLKMKTYNGLLYPINDCEVLRWSFSGNSSQYKYVLYKTKINNEDYFVMYCTYSDLIPIKDFYSAGLINRNVSYSEPLIRLDNRVASSFDYGGYYRIKIARVFTGDYDYAVRMMFQNNFSIPVINPAEVLGLNTLEGFSER